jgi:CubicO group peptidase (beta-lactamase class C family)
MIFFIGKPAQGGTNRMKNKAIVIFILTLLIGTTLIPSSISEHDKLYNINDKDYSPLDQFFNQILNLLMKIGHYPSLSACIIKNDEVVWSDGFGLYDIENEKYATENTIYITCSISKPITGTALMQLYDQELFDLDDDINDYLPFSIRNPNFPNDPITFRMLLSHASSLNEDPDSFYWLNYSNDPPISWFPIPWLNDYLMPDGKYYIPEIWDNENPPGTETEYANVNFDIISYLVELISGEPFIEYCDKYVLKPLEMYNSSFNLSYLDLDNVAIPYHYYNDEYYTINNLPDDLWRWWDTPPSKHYRYLHYPSGGFYSSVSDLSHFLIMHMNGGVYNGVRILREDTVEEMHKIQPPGIYYMGLAWFYTRGRFGNFFAGHEGDHVGAHSSMKIHYPINEYGVIYFVNGDRISLNDNEYNSLSFRAGELIRSILFIKARHY